MPGLRFSLRSFVAPENVGVAPRILCEEAASIVMLWSSGDMFVNAIETLPALAVSAVLSYFSWPSGLAASARLWPVLGPAEADCVDVVVDVVLDDVAGEELVPLEELPQPASASRPTARVNADSRRIDATLLRSDLLLDGVRVDRRRLRVGCRRGLGALLHGHLR